MEPSAPLVWYVAYGSNMHWARLMAYIAGGRPEGAAREYPGCRERQPPGRAQGLLLDGELYFAGVSTVWGGGSVFYDPEGKAEVAARAYLVTARQFSDIAAQEMHRLPGRDLDPEIAEAASAGRSAAGPGRYETLVCAGELAGFPLLTFTAPWRRAEAPLNPPSAAYLRHLASGLVEAHGWDAERVAAYLDGWGPWSHQPFDG
jgi:hypothetical protein